jgi:hypothetical protein
MLILLVAFIGGGTVASLINFYLDLMAGRSLVHLDVFNDRWVLSGFRLFTHY